MRSLYCISISQGTSWRGNIFFKELPWRVRLSPGAQMPAQNSWLFLENAGAQNLGTQKENPRASALVSGWREGSERRGASSLLLDLRAKDPILTLAAVGLE